MNQIQEGVKEAAGGVGTTMAMGVLGGTHPVANQYTLLMPNLFHFVRSDKEVGSSCPGFAGGQSQT